MRRAGLALVTAVLAAALTPAIASAQPPIGFGFEVHCTDGSVFDVSFGPPKNQGTAIHIVGSNSILTSNGFAITTDGVTAEFKPRGLPAVDHGGDGVTCVGGIAFEDENGTPHTQVWTITGWITPRG